MLPGDKEVGRAEVGLLWLGGGVELRNICLRVWEACNSSSCACTPGVSGATEGADKPQ